ncbi:UDP-N-acetylglucosamine 2-epimerase [uncultured Arsenicicoccus sp.]|uniref:UDP-N-acetylglucosamine 2-epimerase n=1 Tax=uncultured Arsenicicoccus sp. TaxID=491339 RepID=UPI00259878B8|nr:UDP-N-acetylglucosamine 2-epimerase [uncultured Arsenicicoccus sp.]
MTQGSRTVAVFVGTRADLGPLSPVISALADDPDVELHILTGVAYDVGSLASTLQDVAPRARTEGRLHALCPPVEHLDPHAVVRHGARLAEGAARLLPELRPDTLVVLGDRWELLYVVPAAFLLGIPVVHLHGGEVTEGAVDERVRHAVTKLADQHCVASADAARRVRQMGEPAERVHVTGAPGLDRLASSTALSDAELADLLGVPVLRPLALFTYHPPTAEGEVPVAQWASEALRATLETCGTVIATHPGLDPGREEILAVLEQAALEHPELVVVESLGSRYPRALHAVDVVVGNSSSGIIEAASAHVPAVDVGERQRGRLRGDNVIHAAEGYDAVRAAIEQALSPQGRAAAAAADNPYGRGDAAARVLAVVRRAPTGGRTKPFAEIEGADR